MMPTPLERRGLEVGGRNGGEVDGVGLHDVYYPQESTSAAPYPARE